MIINIALTLSIQTQMASNLKNIQFRRRLCSCKVCIVGTKKGKNLSIKNEILLAEEIQRNADRVYLSPLSEITDESLQDYEWDINKNVTLKLYWIINENEYLTTRITKIVNIH